MNRPHCRKVLECASPLALSDGPTQPECGRGLPQSKTQPRWFDAPFGSGFRGVVLDIWKPGMRRSANLRSGAKKGISRNAPGRRPALLSSVSSTRCEPVNSWECAPKRSASLQPALANLNLRCRSQTGAPSSRLPVSNSAPVWDQKHSEPGDRIPLYLLAQP